jgi:leucyl aminopeptidase
MDVLYRRGNIAQRPVGATVVGVYEGERTLGAAAAALDRASRGAITALRKSGDFTGRHAETAVLYPSGLRTKRVILVGLGRAKALTPHRILLATAQAARRVRDSDAKTFALPILGADSTLVPLEAAARAIAEGVVLGHYRYAKYQTKPGHPALRRAEIIGEDASPALTAAVERGARWAEATCLARDLAATPGQDLTPEGLAERAKEIGRQSGARVEILDVPQMERLGMGALLAVGRGSAHPPRFIVLERGPKPTKTGGSVPTVVVIGKGVTFDTGGISLKPGLDMGKMKYDMSGAAAVLGLFSALPTLELPFRVVGLIPSAENMPDGRAMKPGDVLRALDGSTIEVTNTDAEGRLVLADALGYARRFEPEAVVDLATLTGAITIALGPLAAGLFTSDDALANALLDAGTATGERLWRMPLWDEYAAALKSDTADLVNSAGREGGAILGATFLKHFAGGMTWAHLDIASTAWAPSDRPHERRGPTGFGVRLLLEWLSRRAVSSAPRSAS